MFATIAGGLWVLLGPTVGGVFTQVLAETLRVPIQGSATVKNLLGRRGSTMRSTQVHWN